MNVKFFSEFRSPDGKTHWAINTYNTSNGIVTFMRDLKFDGMSYDSNQIAPVKLSDEDFQDDSCPGRFYVDAVSNKKFVVVDRIHDKEIAVFVDIADANHFCDMKNGNELYARI